MSTTSLATPCKCHLLSTFFLSLYLLGWPRAYSVFLWSFLAPVPVVINQGGEFSCQWIPGSVWKQFWLLQPEEKRSYRHLVGKIQGMSYDAQESPHNRDFILLKMAKMLNLRNHGLYIFQWCSYLDTKI